MSSGECNKCGYQAGALNLINGLCENCKNNEQNEDSISSLDDNSLSNCSYTTKLLMSAAHLYPDDFNEDVTERIEHPYKAPSPELGIETEKIKKAVDDSKGRHFGKSIFLFFIFLVALPIFFQDPDDNFGVIVIALCLAFIAELLYLRSAKKKVRAIMNTENLYKFIENSSNNIVISGGYSPFIGAGFDLDSWSFTVDLKLPENKKEPISHVSVGELFNEIEGNLRKLNIDNMILKDELFINGKDINILDYMQVNGRLSKPINSVDSGFILNKINKNDKRERYYKVVRIPMWDGQIYLSMYYRFLEINGNLYTEAKFFLLPPLKKKYLDISKIPIVPTLREFWKDVSKSIFTGAFSWIVVYFRFFVFIQGGFLLAGSQRKKWKREVEADRLYNYGWDNSLREKWAEANYESYFQKIDIDFTSKIFTNEFLTTLLNYLSDRNISTEQFKQTTSKIINEGVMVTGGEVKADTLVVGKGAKATNTKFS